MNLASPASLPRVLRHFVSLLLLLSLVSPASGVQTDSQTLQPPPAADYAQILQQLQTAVAAEKKALEDLRRQSEALTPLTREHQSALNAWRIQAATGRSLLTLPQPKPGDLTQAAENLQDGLDNVTTKIESVVKKLSEIRGLQSDTQTLASGYQQNLAAMAQNAPSDPDATRVKAELEGLIGVIAAKGDALNQIEAHYAQQAEELNQIQSELSGLSSQLAEKIREVRTQTLFERAPYSLDLLARKSREEFITEILALGGQIGRMGLYGFWVDQLDPIWRGRGLLLVTTLLLYGALRVLIFRLKRLINTWRRAEIWDSSPAWRLVLLLISRSLVLAGTIGFIYLYAAARDIPGETPILNALVNGLWIVLFTRWFLSLIKIGALADPPRIPKRARRQLQAFMWLIRYGALAHVAITWLQSEATLLPALVRLILIIALLAWLLTLHATFKDFRSPDSSALARRLESQRPLIRGVLWAVPAVALILETLGYGALSLHWLVGWGRSLTVITWSVLLYAALKEWNQKFYSPAPTPQAKSAQPIKWLLCRLCWLVWAAALALALVLSWSDPKAVLGDLQKIFYYTIAIGDLKINLIRLFKAFLILFFTHLLVRVGRHALQAKVLEHSGLEIGLRASIVTMTVYLAWGLGILAALYALGLSGTSLTVAFGALSIGLGFGLQNIFNNFISGIIMLFERPIQVGDAIEISGTWGEVRKINFRSTVVQTYDNSSLIIPNSEFISNPVTNWSFRDQSLRVKINVGVAYGSDIERVRQILLEIADRTPNVRKYPRPDVLFADFGDSSLNFTLRVWTDIDNMLKVGTAIRFEIDRVFRQEGVEIPFPQRDVHLRPSDPVQPQEPIAAGSIPGPAGESGQ